MNLSLIVSRTVGCLISWVVYYFNCIRWVKPARPGKIIWVNPSEIENSIEFSKIVKQKRVILNGIVLRGDWDKTNRTVNFYHSELFDAFYSHFKEGKNLKETSYFKRKIKSENVDEERIDKYNSFYDKLFNEIKNNGFRISNSLFDGIDDFKVSIDSNGGFLFMTGKHRLAIARLMGDDFKIPAKVSHRHIDWQKYRDKLYKGFIQGKITKEDIRSINHPDLMDIVEE